MAVVILYYIVIYLVTIKITMSLTLLLLVSIIAVTTFLPLVEEGYGQATANNQQTPSNEPIDCKSIASQIGSNAFPILNPHKEICDISIMRQSPEITDQNGTVLNKFLAINSLVEIMGDSSAAATMSGTDSNNTTVNASSSAISTRQNVMAMGEFALLQTELQPVLKILSKTNWTIVAIHNHAILENPKTIFVHWDAKGPVQSIVSPIKEVLAIQQQSAQEGNEAGLGSQQQSAANNSSENPLAEIGEKIGDVFTGGGEEKK
jgi:hypothetical protein